MPNSGKISLIDTIAILCEFYRKWSPLEPRFHNKIAVWIFVSTAILVSGPVWAQVPPAPTINVGPQTITINTGMQTWWQQPDSAIAAFPNRTGTTSDVMFGDGGAGQFIGSSLDNLAEDVEFPSAVVQAPGSHSYGDVNYDGNGSWMIAAQRATDGSLVGLVHTEDHVFANGVYGEWDTSGIWTSNNDGLSWTNLGEILGAPIPADGQYGGFGASEMIYCPQQGGWLAYAGSVPILSKDPHGAPGTWYGYYNGSFSTKMVPSQPVPADLSAAPGLSGDNVTWGNITYNSYLKAYTFIWVPFGSNTVNMVLSSDGLNWGSPTALFTQPNGIAYTTLVGTTPLSTTATGQDCLITYAYSPSGDLNNHCSLAENWVHFGPITTPAVPAGVTSSSSQTYDSAINLSWQGVAEAQVYNVWRQTGSAPFSQVATVTSSSATPNYVDRSVSLSSKYSYMITAGNSAGTSGNSSVTTPISPSTNYFPIEPVAGLPNYAIDSSGVAVGGNPLVEWYTGTGTQKWSFSNGPNYAISNQSNGYVLDVPGGSTTNGTWIDLAQAVTGSTEQEWQVYQAGGAVSFVNVLSGDGLSIVGQWNYDGDHLCQWSGIDEWLVCSLPPPANVITDSPGYDSSVTVSWSTVPSAQAYSVWRYDSNGNRVAYIGGVVPSSNTGTISFVDRQVTPGVIYTYAVTAFDTYAFSFFATSGFSATSSFTPKAKYYKIQNVCSGLVLDSTGVGLGGTLLQQTAVAGSTAQNWQLLTTDGVNFAIVNEADGYTIDDPGASTTAGVHVDLAKPAGTQGSSGAQTAVWTTSQLFSVGSDSLGTLLQNSFTGLYLNDVGYFTWTGNPQCLWSYDRGNNEDWTLIAQ